LESEVDSIGSDVIKNKGAIKTTGVAVKAELQKEKTSICEMVRRAMEQVNLDMSKEAAMIMKNAEVTSLQKKHDIEKLTDNYSRMHAQAQQSLKETAGQREKLKKRYDESEVLLRRLNSMISELQVRLDKQTDVKMGFDDTVQELREELIDRIRGNESMFDTEMDAFKRVVDGLSGQVEGVRIVQSAGVEGLPAPAFEKAMSDLDGIKSRMTALDQMTKNLSENVSSQDNEVTTRVSEDYDNIKDRLADSEQHIGKLNSMITDLHKKMESSDNNTDVKVDLENVKNEVDNRMNTINGLIDEVTAWKNEISKQKMGDISPTDRKELEKMNSAISSLDTELHESREEMKNFKQYVISYINNLVNTYENRMVRIKKDIDYKIKD